MTWSEHIIQYYFQLDPPQPLPGNVQWLHPQKDKKVQEVVKSFYRKYYNDDYERVIMLGINPGRFGAGVTGVNFTAPRQLKEHCGIVHAFKDQSELSAEFIYEMIAFFGGPETFYQKVLIGSVCPLGFTRNGKNINYYDEKELLKFLEPFLIQTLNELLYGMKYNRTCIAVGGEKNYTFLSRMNEKEKWFDSIFPLPHPRFIMQYKRPAKNDFIHQYTNTLNTVLSMK